RAEGFSWGFVNFIELSKVRKICEGFVHDGKILLEADVTIVRSKHYISEKPDVDFAYSRFSNDMVTLKFKDGEHQICRKYLTWHSQYFASLFA
ncbi:hypothetical protein PMAYCL1PPCAC_33521, partial [Pristionchus mayeri]